MNQEYVTEEEKYFLFKEKTLPRLYVEFLHHQREVKGLASGTIHNLKKPVLAFLITYPKYATSNGIKTLRAKHVHDYVTKTAIKLSRHNKSKLINGLREFFRFLFIEEHHPKDLSFCVPSVIIHRLTSFHRGLSQEKIHRVLSVPDRKTHVGRRDYAILLLLASYGIRQGQLIALLMQDINWKNKTIYFKAVKGGKDVTMPLFPNIAEALLKYFAGGRREAPPQFKQVFLTCGSGGSAADGQRPLGKALWYMIHRRFSAAGINQKSYEPKGAHSFRHAFATRLIEDQQPLKTVSDLLGHKSINTTFIYTKSNLTRLRKLCQPWPTQEQKK
jgi:site-specific recombinase XerD